MGCYVVGGASPGQITDERWDQMSSANRHLGGDGTRALHKAFQA